MALTSGYAEMKLDREKWTFSFRTNDEESVRALGWLIIDTLMKGKGEPVVVMFDEEEVKHGTSPGRQATESL